MPTVNTPPKPVTTPNRPPLSSPPGHHAVPRSVPLNAPSPQPQPMPSPVGIGVITMVEIATKTIVCPIGQKIKANKKKPAFNGGSPRRQSPCPGTTDKPRVERVEKKRKIGRFIISRIQTRMSVYKGASKHIVEKETKRVAKEAGYTPPTGSIKIVSELDRPRTLWENLRYQFGAGDDCFYQVYAVEDARKCTCPDGSKCRSTVRKD